MKLRDKSVADIKPEILQTALAHFQRIEAVRGQLHQAFDGLAPRLPGDPGKAQALRRLFLDRMEAGHEFELTEEGSINIYKDGRRLENEHGYAVPLDAFVRDVAAQTFDLDTSTANGTGTATGKATTGTASGKKMTEDEYLSKFDAAKTKEERQSIVEAWKEQNS